MPEVSVRLVLDDLRVEYRGSRAFYERTIEPLIEAARPGADAGAAAAPSLEPRPVPASRPRGYTPASAVHFSQFVTQVGPRALDPDQRAMAFAFYLWNYERQDDFATQDIAAFFRTVLEEPPDDISAMLGDLAARRRFLEAGTQEERWRLTTKGVNYVKNRLLASP